MLQAFCEMHATCTYSDLIQLKFQPVVCFAPFAFYLFMQCYSLIKSPFSFGCIFRYSAKRSRGFMLARAQSLKNSWAFCSIAKNVFKWKRAAGKSTSLVTASSFNLQEFVRITQPPQHGFKCNAPEYNSVNQLLEGMAIWIKHLQDM